MGFISSFRKKNPAHLPWKARVRYQSGIKERNQAQGQIYSTAVIRRLSTELLVLIHHRRSDLIGSRLGLYKDLETPKVCEFTSGVPAGKTGEKGLFGSEGKRRLRKTGLTKGNDE